MFGPMVRVRPFAKRDGLPVVGAWPFGEGHIYGNGNLRAQSKRGRKCAAQRNFLLRRCHSPDIPHVGSLLKFLKGNRQHSNRSAVIQRVAAQRFASEFFGFGGERDQVARPHAGGDFFRRQGQVNQQMLQADHAVSHRSGQGARGRQHHDPGQFFPAGSVDAHRCAGQDARVNAADLREVQEAIRNGV